MRLYVTTGSSARNFSHNSNSVIFVSFPSFDGLVVTTWAVQQLGTLLTQSVESHPRFPAYRSHEVAAALTLPLLHVIVVSSFHCRVLTLLAPSPRLRVALLVTLSGWGSLLP